MISLGSGRDQLGSRRDQLRLEVILPGSRRGSAEDRRGRRRAAGVVVELSILPVALRRAAEDVVELRGRCRAVAAPRRAAVDVVVGLSLFLAVVRRRSEPQVNRIAASPNNPRARRRRLRRRLRFNDINYYRRAWMSSVTGHSFLT